MTEQTEPFVTAYNTTDGPLVIDQAGRVLGGGEHGTVRADRAPARALLESGQLVEVEHRDDPDVSDEGRRVFAETATANEGASRSSSSPQEAEQQSPAAPGEDAPEPARTTRRRRSSGQTEEA